MFTSYQTIYNEDEYEEVERIPWSILGEQFIEVWGRANPENPQPEHLEILGFTGSGKSFLLTQILSEMARRRKSSIIYIVNKPADGAIAKLNWPIVDSWDELVEAEKKYQVDQFIFWPQTSSMGTARAQYQEERIQELLENLWHPGANTIVVFDEFATLEKFSKNMKDLLNQYLREGRSQGITCVMGKQRGQGVQRDMHSESTWTICFKLKNRNDVEYAAEMFGDKKEYIPILQSLSKEKHEFLIQSKNNEATYISWVDKPKPLYSPMHKRKDTFG